MNHIRTHPDRVHRTRQPHYPPIRCSLDAEDLVFGSIRSRAIDARPLVAPLLSFRSRTFLIAKSGTGLEETLQIPDPGDGRRLDQSDLDGW
jgi:hypothetical protein